MLLIELWKQSYGINFALKSTKLAKKFFSGLYLNHGPNQNQFKAAIHKFLILFFGQNMFRRIDSSIRVY
jgi:hypothetical protein